MIGVHIGRRRLPLLTCARFGALERVELAWTCKGAEKRVRGSVVAPGGDGTFGLDETSSTQTRLRRDLA